MFSNCRTAKIALVKVGSSVSNSNCMGELDCVLSLSGSIKLSMFSLDDIEVVFFAFKGGNINYFKNLIG